MNIEHLNNLKKKSIKLKNPNMQRLTVEKKANERKKKVTWNIKLKTYNKNIIRRDSI